jgi:hypothetical protein
MPQFSINGSLRIEIFIESLHLNIVIDSGLGTNDSVWFRWFALSSTWNLRTPVFISTNFSRWLNWVSLDCQHENLGVYCSHSKSGPGRNVQLVTNMWHYCSLHQNLNMSMFSALCTVVQVTVVPHIGLVENIVQPTYAVTSITAYQFLMRDSNYIHNKSHWQ